MIYRKIISLVSLLALAACTDPDATTRALSHQGIKNVTVTGYRFLGCPEDDGYRTGFIGVDQNNQTVTGVACSGLFTGTIIRFD